MISARNHIERKARMDQPHRARQFDFIGFNQNEFALDAAKLALFVACRKPAAIDHDAVDISGFDLAVESNRAAGLADARMQFGENFARLDMALVGVKKTLAKAPLQRRFDFADALRIKPPVTA